MSTALRLYARLILGLPNFSPSRSTTARGHPLDVPDELLGLKSAGRLSSRATEHPQQTPRPCYNNNVNDRPRIPRAAAIVDVTRERQAMRARAATHAHNTREVKVGLVFPRRRQRRRQIGK